ncbi:MAG: TlyA family RNA methyltransferase [Dehalococcoidia bacterium]
MARRRADVLLVERGLVESRDLARRLILGGRVRSGSTVLVKPATLLHPDAELKVVEPARYVSRGGHKLEEGLRAFSVDVTGLRCLDIGASTGGFTDCLLQHGAAEVVAVDVGRAQLHWKLRQDPRVTLLEKTNARDLPDVGEFAVFVADVSFISLRLILPAVARRAVPGTPGVVLLKPQFEAGRELVPRGGVIRDAAVRKTVRDEFGLWLEREGWPLTGMRECTTRGADGNVEYLVGLMTPGGDEFS